ncbi:MAG: hypothetical protein HKO57_01180, partial [Akkermansiaceae bacterium]|nr:hypothetical protein [Akkermansiaceae bacterium]
APPAPVSDCDACNTPGGYGGVSLLYLKPYGSDGSEGDGDWDLGARGTLGFERPDGLFYELNGFWYEGEFDPELGNFESIDSDIAAYYIEGLIGDNLYCGEACLDVAFGLRYANLETERTSVRFVDDPFFGPPYTQRSTNTEEFEGIGPVIRIDGTRRLTDQVTLYGGLSQAILFGETDSSFSDTYTAAANDTTPPPGSIPSNSSGGSSRDELAFVTEIEAGLLFHFNMGQVQGAHLRVGIEGQYWSIGRNDLGLLGGVLGVGFNF